MRLAVDFHAHFYPEFSEARALNVIATHTRAAKCDAAVICLTETQSCDWFSKLDQSGGRVSLVVYHEAVPIVFIRGFQIVTAERIELHALGGRKRVIDGASLRESIAQILADEAVPVLPWGVGKWLGERGRVVSDLLSSDLGHRVLVSDSRHRPPLWPQPLQFTGRRVLRGSDPLPLAGEEGSLLGFGDIYEAPDQEIQSVTLSQLIVTNPIGAVGSRVSLGEFFALQARLRLR